MIIHKAHLQKIDQEDKKIVGNTYIIKKRYDQHVIWFIARLAKKKMDVYAIFNGANVHYYYFDEYFTLERDGKQGEINVPYMYPYTGFFPDCKEFNLFSIEFFTLRSISSSLKKNIHIHHFLQCKPEFQAKTKIPGELIHYYIEEYI
jgi:hypothetical protein